MIAGRDKVGEEPYESFERSHKMAIMTGATKVFMRDLCTDMMKLHMLTGDEDMGGILQACAARLLYSPKCHELEALVEQVMEHPDGMPEVENKALLAEVMACYSDAARAERTGMAARWRREHLVPGIMQESMPQGTIDDDEATGFINSINAYNSIWESFTPTSPFQQIVCNAINTLPHEG